MVVTVAVSSLLRILTKVFSVGVAVTTAPSMVVMYGTGFLVIAFVIVATTPLRTLTKVSGSGVTVTVVPPTTVTKVWVMGWPGVETTTSVTGDPPTSAVTVPVCAVRPSSGRIVWTVWPPNTPVTVWRVWTGGGETTVALPAASVVVWGGGFIVAVIAIVVVVPPVITMSVLISGVAAIIVVVPAVRTTFALKLESGPPLSPGGTASMMRVGSVPANAALERPINSDMVVVNPDNVVACGVGSVAALLWFAKVVIDSGDDGAAPAPFG